MDSPREPPGPAVFKAPPPRSLHAFFDANVLLPAYLRTVFLDLADAGLIAPHWSREVLVELRRNLVSRKFGVEPESADRLLREHPETVPAVLRQTCRRMKRPPLSQIDLLGILERSACAAFAKKLAAAWGFVAE